MKKIYIIAGEASGDLHGSNLVEAMNKANSNLIWRGWGGKKLESKGVTIDVRYEDANFMGFVEVVKNLPKILKLFKITKASILEFKPDAIILIDYPGFNLRMAKWAKSHHIPVYYYIAPQVWAWKESRVKIIRECVRKLFVILPFEKEYFKKHNIDAEYFGHPLMQYVKDFKSDSNFRKRNNLDNRSIIALLPGSRTQEIKTMLPLYLQALNKECKHQIVIAGLTQHQELYNDIRSSIGLKTSVVYNDTYNLLSHSRAAIVTSGTATLETALFKVPQVVCYKGNALSYHIARQLIKVPFISLVNLIAERKIITELIQNDTTSDNIRKELYSLLTPVKRQEIIKDYNTIHEKLLNNTNVSDLAKSILGTLKF
ncbi:MAG: lipid-A-disaccharide synthase [Saprospiraceae bacterium]|nr:lipid-A-disaccharide synthase [Saprospiraceae bacterium]